MSDTPSTAPSLARRRLVAVLMSFTAPGSGHWALGRWRRGLVWPAMLVVALALFAWSPWPMFGGVLILLSVAGAVVDVCRIGPAQALPSARRVAMVWVAWLAAMLALRAGYRAAIVEVYRIPAASMLPTLHIGEHIVVSKLAYVLGEPQRGDVVVFDHPCSPGTDFRKRIVATGGDTVGGAATSCT